MMKNKAFIIVLIMMMGFTFFNAPEKAGAVGEGAVARVLVGSVGERTLAAVAEKAGIKYATKTARERAMKRWNKDLLDQVTTIETSGVTAESTQLRETANMFKNLTDADVIPIPEKPGFGKVLVKGAMFLTGADLIYEGYKAIRDSQEQQKLFEYMNETTDAIKSGEVMTSTMGARAFAESTAIYIGWNSTYASSNISSPVIGTKPFIVTWTGYTTSYNTDHTGVKVSFQGVKMVGTDIYGKAASKTFSGSVITPFDRYIPIGDGGISDTNTVAITPTVADLPETTNIQPWLDAPPETVTDTVEVEIPIANDYPETVGEPWNQPITGEELAPKPEPEPEPETEPDGSTPIDDSKCTKPIDLTKIKHLGTNISTTFPFSIPWDIYNAFDSVFGGMTDQGKPEWTFKFAGGEKYGIPNTFKFGIPDFFDKWMGFIHGLILIGWNVGLIYALRKWFGGAS